MKKQISILIALLLFIPILAEAVSITSSGGNLVADVSPENPSAGETTTISLTGYGFDINASYIVWKVNDKESNQGGKQFVFQMGPVGSSTKIDVTVQANDGERMTKTFYFTAEDVLMIWQANTYTPPFYHGKALPTSGSLIKVLAIPNVLDQNGKALSKNDLVFNWQRNGNSYKDISGSGKDSFIFTESNNLSPDTIDVTVSDRTNSVSTHSSVTISPVSPQILFYEDKPLEGVNYAKNIGREFDLIGNEIKIKAEPYFFSASSTDGLNYQWTIDNQPAINDKNDPSILALAKKAGTEGVDQISLNLSNLNNLLQNANGVFTVKFGSTNSPF